VTIPHLDEFQSKECIVTFTVKKNVLLQNGNPVTFVPTKNMGNAVRPLYLIIHYTAGTTAASAINHFAKPGTPASAHLIIDTNGDVTQMVPFDRVAWHAGISEWGDIKGLNRFSIGIEIVNAGKLKKNEAGDWLTWSKHKIKPEDVTVATHDNERTPSGWHMYEAIQIDQVSEIGSALHEYFGFLDVLGHDQISPRRKVDPGPAFPMTRVKSQIMGRMS
jgi:N-acetylmuramoyl-L-alanine amidase